MSIEQSYSSSEDEALKAFVDCFNNCDDSFFDITSNADKKTCDKEEDETMYVWVRWGPGWFAAKETQLHQIPKQFHDELHDLYKKENQELFLFVKFFTDGLYSKVRRSAVQSFDYQYQDMKKSKSDLRGYTIATTEMQNQCVFIQKSKF